MIVSPNPLIPFSQLVEDIENLARTHAGQAKQLVHASFLVDEFASGRLDKALVAVMRARTEGERRRAFAGLAVVLAPLEVRSQDRAQQQATA